MWTMQQFANVIVDDKLTSILSNSSLTLLGAGKLKSARMELERLWMLNMQV